LEYNSISRSSLSKIGKLPTYNTNIDDAATEAVRKKGEAQLNVRVNDSKVEAAAERGAKTMLLTMFDDTHTSKLKHPIKLYTGVSYFELINHLCQQYVKLHQINITELMGEMKHYYDVNKRMSKYFKKMKK